MNVAPEAQLRLFQLSSAALPVGAFAYSQGLEQAAALGDVHDAESSLAWIAGMLRRSVLSLDVPVLARLHVAFSAGDVAAVRRWNDFLYASRGSAELRAEERQVGGALLRLLASNGVANVDAWRSHSRITLAAGFALAGVSWGAPLLQTALSYVFAWSEAQVGAATRLIPLGQSDAQRVLSGLICESARELPGALERPDDAISSTTPGQLLLSALHESQYSRLFRS